MAVVSLTHLANSRCPCGNLYRVSGWPIPPIVERHLLEIVCQLCGQPVGTVGPFLHVHVEHPL